MRTIWFDMDGTIANLYGQDGWLNDLRTEQVRPYRDAIPMNFTDVDIRRLQDKGFNVGVISWGAKESSAKYLKQVREVKREWIHRHFPSIVGPIHVIPHGVPKNIYEKPGDILIDDEEQNRSLWDSALTPMQGVELARS